MAPSQAGKVRCPETSKWQAVAFLLRVNQSALGAFPPLSAEVVREEEKQAWVRAAARRSFPL